MTNLNSPHFDESERPAGFRSRRWRIGHELASERIGASLWEVPPGERAYPYHFHFSDEELVIVLAGRPTLRTPSGERELEQGEVVRFPTGEAGAHQLANRGSETVRFLSLSTHGAPDVVVYPDSNKIGAAERLPTGGGLMEFYRRESAVDYWDGESQ